MDKDKNKKTAKIAYEYIKNLTKYIIFVVSVFGIIIELLHIFNALKIKYGGIFSYVMIWIFFCAFIISLIGLIFNRYDFSVFAKTRKIIHSIKVTIHCLRDDFFEANRIILSSNSNNDKEKTIKAVIDMLLPVVNITSETLKDVTGADVRTCIKIIDKRVCEDGVENPGPC